MTCHEVEIAMIQIGKAMKTIVNAYKPNANHISITIVNGNIEVSACEYDGDKKVYIEKDILNATMFADGVLYIEGKYICQEDVNV